MLKAEPLKGNTFIVTGGAQGIGLAFCRAIVEAGGEVAVLDIRAGPDASASALQRAGRYHYFNCDISQESSLTAAFKAAAEALGGRLNGCVTTAGVGLDKPFLNISWQEFDKVVAVNQAGTFFVAQLAVQQMLSQPEDENGVRGSIVMVASRSASGQCPGHLLSAYGGTKGFVKSFSLQLAHEMAPMGIRVNSMSPGYIETELNLNLAKARPEVRHYFNEAPPMKRIGQTGDLTGGLIYLLSDASSYVTGIDLAIDGGMSAGTGLVR